MRTPLFLLPKGISIAASRRLMGIGGKVGDLIPGLKYDLQEMGSRYTAAEYVATSLVNSLFWAFFFFFLLTFLRLVQGALPLDVVAGSIHGPEGLWTFIKALRIPALSALGLGSLFFAVMLFYPRIESRKLGENVDRDLVFALKDMQLQISSGVSLFDAMVNVSKSKYGYVSKEFEETVQDINSGEAADKSLEKMAERSQSDFMRKTLWHLISAIRSGASLQGALKSTIFSMTQYQKSQIRNYSGELNIMALIYMIFAVAIPGLGSTLIIILSAFSNASLGESTYLMIIVFSFLLEIMVIGLIKSRRPSVHF